MLCGSFHAKECGIEYYEDSTRLTHLVFRSIANGIDVFENVEQFIEFDEIVIRNLSKKTPDSMANGLCVLKVKHGTTNKKEIGLYEMYWKRISINY